MVIVGLVIAALAVRSLRRPTLDSHAPSPWLVGAAALVATSAYWMTSGFGASDWSEWAGIVVWCLVAGGGATAISRWARQHGWDARHPFALAAGATLTYVWLAFPMPPADGGSLTADLVSNVVFGCIAPDRVGRCGPGGEAVAGVGASARRSCAIGSARRWPRSLRPCGRRDQRCGRDWAMSPRRSARAASAPSQVSLTRSKAANVEPAHPLWQPAIADQFPARLRTGRASRYRRPLRAAGAATVSSARSTRWAFGSLPARGTRPLVRLGSPAYPR